MTNDSYTKAIKMLVPLAQGDTGGSRSAALILLSIYNAQEFPLEITELCNLDPNYYAAALVVIRGRVELRIEPQELITDGSKIFQELWKLWESYHVKNRGRKYEE